MTFRDVTCEHLAKYKVDELGIEENGLFSFRGKNIDMAHILPFRYHQLNILEEYRSRFFDSKYGPPHIKLHKYFHHLNSSQALCINFFYPLIAEDALGLVAKFLCITSATDLTSCFEKESEVEIVSRRTSFDFHIRYSDTQDIFFEVKYTESGFAKERNDEEHKRKSKDTYRPLVEGSPYLAETCRDEQVFLNHYQVLRNFVHVSQTRQFLTMVYLQSEPLK